MTNQTYQYLSKGILLCVFTVAALPVMASNHREAPITALDHKADITDFFAFVSYTGDQQPNTSPSHVTMILCVDPLLDPSNGPTGTPFDPDIRYQINVDNDHDAEADVVFTLRFSTEFQLPTIYADVVGFRDGARDPETGAGVVPPKIRSFADLGLNLRQTYTVDIARFKNGVQFVPPGAETKFENGDGSPFFAVPRNSGPRTMDYEALFDEATYRDLNVDGASVFAGTVDDPFFIDLGGAFDTAKFRTLGSGVPGVLTPGEDSQDENFAGDTISGFAVNAIAIEVPIEMLTSSGQLEPPDSPAATLGFWATTARHRETIRRAPLDAINSGGFSQIQRFGNPLINELLIGIGFKNRFSMDQPKNDVQFDSFFADPPIVQAVEAIYNLIAPGALDTPEGPRGDLRPLVTYQPPIAAVGTPPGPIADLMRLNTGVPATPRDQASSLGLLGGDPAGMPNGRRLFDDSVDIVLRIVVGGVLDPLFAIAPNNILGDGVNVNDARLRNEFPYLANCPSGRNRRHIDPGETFPNGNRVPVN